MFNNYKRMPGIMKSNIIGLFCLVVMACGGAPSGSSSSSSSSTTSSSSGVVSSSSNSSSTSTSSSSTSSSSSASSSSSGIPFEEFRVQAQDYDDYLELDANREGGGGACDLGEVDLEMTQDMNGVCNVGWVTSGEWLAYNLEEMPAGSYDFVFRIASQNQGLQAYISINGNRVGTIETEGGDWQAFTDEYVLSVSLGNGEHTLRIDFPEGLINFNYFDVKPAGSIGNVSRGRDLFFGDAHCIACHTDLGDGTFSGGLNIDALSVSEAINLGLVEYIYRLMPIQNPEAVCDETCAQDIVAFLRQYKTDNSLAPSTGSYVEGESIFNSQCATCHADERTTGLFSEDNLRANNIYRRDQLEQFVQQSMPINNPGVCDADCAADVVAYIVTWHVLPIDPRIASDEIPGVIDNPIQNRECSQNTSNGQRMLRLLTNEEYQNTVQDLFGFTEDVSFLLPVDGKKGRFKNNKEVHVRSDIEFEGILQAAEQIAEWSAERNFDWANCSSVNVDCANRFMQNIAPQIFRRALTADEANRYGAIARGELTDSVSEGLQAALAGMLSSPQFLYRHELGDLSNNVYALSSYEMASFLSYTFTRSTPQGSLWQAAQNNELMNPTRIRQEAAKLLDTPRATALMEEFIHDWLNTRSLVGIPKDASLFGNDVRAITEAMVEELSLNFSDVMLDENSNFADLYLPGETHANNLLAAHYGISNPGSSNHVKVSAPNHGGILLTGAFLGWHADFDEASPIRRSAYIRRNMLCQFVPPPPRGVSTGRDSKAAELEAYLAEPTTTNRMRFHRLTEGATCLECHAEMINPLGFGLEDYDALGRHRNVDANGNAIDASGRLFSPFLDLQFFGDPERDSSYIPFTGGKGLAQLFAEGGVSDLTQSCLSMQVYSYATGMLVDTLIDVGSPDAEPISDEEKNGYNCDIDDMVNTLGTQGPRQMLEGFGTLDSIRYRKAWPQ